MNLGAKVQTINKKKCIFAEKYRAMKYLLTMICVVAMLFSCSSDDADTPSPAPSEKDSDSIMPPIPAYAGRTVMVYMAAENNLSSYTDGDIKEMLTASKTLPENTNLVLFVDKSDKTSPPYVQRICNGLQETDTEITFDDDFYASDPERMREVLLRMMERYPAQSYGLVLWGHAGGWLIERDTIECSIPAGAKTHRAYGIDTGSDMPEGSGNKWINMPTMAKVLESLPQKFRFIFADCCNFQCVETAYELRNTADYIIGSPAETPVIGAPYDKIVPYMFGDEEDFYRGIVDEYNAMVVNSYERVPMSAIKTSELENLAAASRGIMRQLTEAETLDLEELIYYRGSGGMKVMLDMNDIVMRHVTDETAYGEWKAAFDNAVVCKAMSSHWLTDGFVNFDFNVTWERYGGVSVFVPQRIYDTYGRNYNQTIKQMQWYYAAGVDNN